MLSKAIKYGKEKRSEYYGAKATSCSCRNHGECDWCRDNRLHQTKVELDRILDQLDYYEEYKDKLTDKKEEN